MTEKRKCAECGYCEKRKGIYATRYGFHCKHPDQQFIHEYFIRHGIMKMPGFIGYGKPRSPVPEIKTSPVWCPLKRKGGEKK